MDAFDADVLIYAAVPGNELGAAVLRVLEGAWRDNAAAAVGSVLLIPELLSKPMRQGRREEVEVLSILLGQLELMPVDAVVANGATALAATYGLRGIDATHLATAVQCGADRFITNNRRDFRKSIGEIDIVYPAELT